MFTGMDPEQDLDLRETREYVSTPDISRLNHSDRGASVTSVASPSYVAPNLEVEKECIKLFFANLHVIYYFLDKETFLGKCEREIWSPDPIVLTSKGRRNRSKFLALYNAVVAVGAITAGDDTAVAQSREKVQDFLEDSLKQRSDNSKKKRPIYPPLELAQIYFSKAKTLLGDLFEVCSLESTQTLFLMVFVHGS